MSENKDNGRPIGAPINAVDRSPASVEDYSTISAPVEAHKALQKLYRYLPDELKGRFVRGGGFRVIKDWLEISGNFLPPEIEAKLFALNPIPSSKILQTEYPPLEELVPGLLTAGLSFLIGKPKVGKSWLGMQLAYAVMTGGKIFDKDVEKGRVLYFALEDGERRLQKRMRSQKWPIDEGVDFVLFDEFQGKIGALNSKENSALLLKFIQRLNYRLVIVDTFSRSVMGDQLKVDEMTNALGPLQYYALSQGISFLIIDHMPKNINPSEYDAITHVYGSVAKAGIADSSWALYKERGRYGGTVLAVTGREIEEQNLRLRFDKDLCCWQCEGPWNEVRITNKRKELLEVLEELGPVKANDLADALRSDLPNTLRQLRNLNYANLVEKRPDSTWWIIKKDHWTDH